jgi:hypothetical protein
MGWGWGRGGAGLATLFWGVAGRPWRLGPVVAAAVAAAAPLTTGAPSALT